MNAYVFSQPPLTLAPMLVLVDIQEAIHAIKGCADNSSDNYCLMKIGKLLNVCRELKLPIAHLNRVSHHTTAHNNQTDDEYADLLPQKNEQVYKRRLPSCYSNRSFVELLESVRNPRLLIAGYYAETSFLSTAVESFHRGWRATFLSDCSKTRPFGSFNQKEAHNAVCLLISLYADVRNSDEVFDSLKSNRGNLG